MADVTSGETAQAQGAAVADEVEGSDAAAAETEVKQDQAASKPAERELLCTICGLRACWQ